MENDPRPTGHNGERPFSCRTFVLPMSGEASHAELALSFEGIDLERRAVRVLRPAPCYTGSMDVPRTAQKTEGQIVYCSVVLVAKRS